MPNGPCLDQNPPRSQLWQHRGDAAVWPEADPDSKSRLTQSRVYTRTDERRVTVARASYLHAVLTQTRKGRGHIAELLASTGSVCAHGSLRNKKHAQDVEVLWTRRLALAASPKTKGLRTVGRCGRVQAQCGLHAGPSESTVPRTVST